MVVALVVVPVVFPVVPVSPVVVSVLPVVVVSSVVLLVVPVPVSVLPVVPVDFVASVPVVVPVSVLADELVSVVLAELALVSSEDSELASSTLGLLSELAVSELALLSSDADVEVVLDDVLVTVAPSLVFVALFTTTLVAPNANTMETMANGVINGGVR